MKFFICADHSDGNNADGSDSNRIDKGDASSISSAKKRRFSRLPQSSSSRTDGTDDMKALIKSNCNFACRKRCPTKFKEGLCKKIRDSFWALDEAGRKRWLARFVENDDVDERKKGRPHKLFLFLSNASEQPRR